MTEDIKFRMKKTNEIVEITREKINSKMDLRNMGGEIRLYFGKDYVEITKKDNNYHVCVK